MFIELETTPLLLAGAFVFGTLIGSFLNVVILRLPPLLEFEWRCQCNELLDNSDPEIARPQSIVFSRSKCPTCNNAIRPWENIPIVSYFLLGRKCGNCGSPISMRYPIVELATGILFAVTFLHFGFTIQGFSAVLLTSFLIALTGIDTDYQLLPDNLTLPLMWAGVILSIWSIHTDLLSSVIGAIVGYLSLWLIYHLFKALTGKEGMGYGDFKLLAALGAWLGWQMLPLVILISSVLGALTGLVLVGSGKLNKEKPMPFGPFIAISGWISMIWGSKIVDYYLGSGAFG